jgi:histidine phosphotransfer protein HptB
MRATEETAVTGNLAKDPIDWNALLESVDRDEVFALDLANTFIANSDHELAAITRARDTGDWAALRDFAHVLKGAAANLYASKVTVAAAQLEAAASAGEYADISALADELTVEVKRAIAYWKSKVASTPRR